MKFILVISKYHHNIDKELVIDEYTWINVNTIAKIGKAYPNGPITMIRTTLGDTYYYDGTQTSLVLRVEERLEHA